MAWLFPHRFGAAADRNVDEKISASLLATEALANTAADVKGAAEINQALMENVTFDAVRRAKASEGRRDHRVQARIEATMHGMISQVNNRGRTDGRN